MSLCDICTRPGNCCKKLVLHRKGGSLFTLWDDEDLTQQIRDHDLPFEVHSLHSGPWYVEPWVSVDSGRSYSVYWMKCPLLTAEGRCGDYENRPPLCRSFQPNDGPLCALFTNAITNALHVKLLTFDASVSGDTSGDLR